MAGPDKIQQISKSMVVCLPLCTDYIVAYYDGIAVCCQSMSSVQYACNSTEASAPIVIYPVTVMVLVLLQMIKEQFL